VLAFLLLALLCGVLLPMQAGINARLRGGLGHPLLAALVSFLVGSAALALVALAARVPLPLEAKTGRLPWWAWMGGLLGAVYVALIIVLVPRLGAATLIAAVVAGQLASSLLLDHFALVGYAHHPVNVWRVLGAALLLVGVILIQRN
jgi:bacterial/archaeal transporter family-2 protein